MGPRPQSRKALGNSSSTDQWDLWVLKWSACVKHFAGSLPCASKAGMELAQEKEVCSEHWHQLEPHEPCSILHAWKQGTGVKAGLGSTHGSRAQTCKSWFAASPTGQCWRHLSTADQPVCVSICHIIWNTQIRSFSLSAVFQLKRLQVWGLWNELL